MKRLICKTREYRHYYSKVIPSVGVGRESRRKIPSQRSKGVDLTHSIILL
jgi:hypothetical protein